MLLNCLRFPKRMWESLIQSATIYWIQIQFLNSNHNPLIFKLFSNSFCTNSIKIINLPLIIRMLQILHLIINIIGKLINLFASCYKQQIRPTINCQVVFTAGWKCSLSRYTLIIILFTMAITSFEEKENRKIWVPIRDGNRGGWSLFDWEKVREMPYRDREMYLGNSAKIGILDKGGKWRKKDWYLKKDKLEEGETLTREQLEVMRKDKERMMTALGMVEKDQEDKLTPAEMQMLLKKIKGNKELPVEMKQDAVGLGFDKLKVEIRSKPGIQRDNPHRLEGNMEENEDIKKKQDEHNLRHRHKHDRSQEDDQKQKKRKKQKTERRKKDRREQSEDQDHLKRSKRDRSRSRGKQKKQHKHRHRIRSSHSD